MPEHNAPVVPDPFFDLGFLPAHEGSTPCMLTPADESTGKSLVDKTRTHQDWIRELLARYGAILFRGFQVDSAQYFEDIAKAIAPKLQAEYLGTSPRRTLTPHVFSASELPSYYPIPQHCEMSYIKSPPERLFFWSRQPPKATGGETPLVDFRKVFEDLDAGVRTELSERGIRIIRNYAGRKNTAALNLWQLKNVEEMFGTRDKATVTAKCLQAGFEAEWLHGDQLRITHQQPAMNPHPESGLPTWFNHLQVFHLAAGPAELERIYRFRPTLRAFFWWKLTKGIVAWKRHHRALDEHPMHCTYPNGDPIPDEVVHHVLDTIWKHLIVFPWKRYDIIAIDNRAVGHGRLPYQGPRDIAVAWS